MRFIGSKKLLLKNIELVIKQNIRGNLKIFCDIFSGTAVVGEYFKKKYKIISNDNLYFSYVLQNAKIGNNTLLSFNGLKKTGLKNPISYLNNLSTSLTKNCFIYNNYSPNLNCNRAYLSNNNAIKIDLIRSKINKWFKKKRINSHEFYSLLASLIEAIPSVSNIAGTYGAFLKNKDKRFFKKIKLEKFQTLNGKYKNQCHNEDANKLIKKLRGDILYLDPPYNARQYIANYHLLETVARYDSPKIKGLTGLRINSQGYSKYCSKSKALEELTDLVKNARFKYILMSYSNEGIIPEKSIEKLFKKYGDKKTYKKYKFAYRRYKRTKDKETKKLNELIFFIRKNG